MGITEIMGSNPLQAKIFFFSCFIFDCLCCIRNCDDLFHSSNMWFYIYSLFQQCFVWIRAVFNFVWKVWNFVTLNFTNLFNLSCNFHFFVSTLAEKKTEKWWWSQENFLYLGTCFSFHSQERLQNITQTDLGMFFIYYLTF